ncbi:MAG TPA: photosynthetic reaction center cytochrome PufC [Gemmatirosa sp.]
MRRRSLVALTSLLALAGCQVGKKETAQLGYRGVAEEQNIDVSNERTVLARNVALAPLPPAPPNTPVGRWQNVQVLVNLPAGEFTRTMQAMTNWVAPKTGSQAGCIYCHNPANYASDEKYAKVVSRRMLLMTRDLNTNWRAHVKLTGVTCYTCHYGAPVPRAGLWHETDQNQYLRAYLDRSDVRVQSYTVPPTSANYSSIRQADWTYALMINMSNSLGVNCTFCHNSRSWASWQNAPWTRVSALYGLRMTRHINETYVGPLGTVLPPVRLGERGDPPLVGCATCHNGVHKPLAGVSMVVDYPALWGHPGPWNAKTPADTAYDGIVDRRDAVSGVPTDSSSFRTPDPYPRSRPAPVPPSRATTSDAVSAVGAALGTIAMRAAPAGTELPVSGPRLVARTP